MAYITERILVLFLIILPSLLLFSQENIQFHDVSDGLSQRTITDIVQDKDGFLWVGTLHGLNKFDGYRYVQYYHTQGDSNSLIRNNITSLAIDQYNNLWIGTYGGGLDKLNLETGIFTHFNTTNRRLNNDYVTKIHLDDNQLLWVGTNKGGINIIDTKTDTHQTIIGSIDLQQFGNHYITSISGQGKTIVAGSWNGDLIVIDYEHGTAKIESVGNYPIRCVTKLSNDRYLIGTNKGLFTFDKNIKALEHDQFSNALLKESVILSAYADKVGNQFIGTENDGLFFQSHTGELHNFHTNQENFLKPISGNSIWEIFQDSNGIIWIGFYLKGLNKIDELENKFQTIQQFKNQNTFIQLDLVRAIEESKDSLLWIGTDGRGLFSYDLKSATLKTHESIWNPSSDKVITSLLFDSSNNLWIGTWQEGVKIYDPVTGLTRSIGNSFESTHSITSNNIHSILEDKNENIWIARFEESLDIFDKSGRKIKSITTPELISTKILVLEKDCDGNIIIGTEGSGIRMLQLNEVYDVLSTKAFLNNTSKQHYNHMINDLFVDSHCNLWIGSSEGLILKPYLQDSFFAYHVEDGLPSNMILSIEEDNNGVIWVSTNQGIFSFNHTTKSVQSYNKQDGLLSNDFSREASLRSSSGKLFFGNTSGINYFFPDSLKSNTRIPKLYLTNIFVSDQKIEALDPKKKNQTIFNGQNIVLNHNQNDIRFEFTSLNFTQAKQNQFQYRLEGLDDDWQRVNHERYAYYRDLKPGTYTFFVKGSNNDEVWNEEPISFSFSIRKPFYNTFGAWAVYLFCIGFILYFFMKNLLHREKLQADLELEQIRIEQFKEIDKMKSNFFTNISHEFMTPLTMIISPLKGLKKKDQNHLDDGTTKIILRNAERLEKYIRQILDLSKLEFNNVQLKVTKVELTSYLESITSNFDNLAKAKSIKIESLIPDAPIFLYFDSDKLEQVFVNLLSNAIKYSESDTKINIEVVPNKDTVKINIKDRGLGISSDHIHLIFDRFYREKNENEINGTGLGLAITKQLVELHKGTIDVKSVEGEGSCFTVILPKGNAHFRPEQLTNVSYVPTPVHTTVPEKVQPKEIPINDKLPIILVVEDNPDIRNYIKNYFDTRYNVIVAEDGAIGYKLAQKSIPDVIITDVMMPNMNGFELCRNLRKNQLTSHIAIIVLTGKSSENDQKMGFEIGANHYISKPFNPELLELRVKNILNYRDKLSNQVFQSNTTEDETSLANLDVSPVDVKFLETIENLVLKNIQNSKFSIAELSKELAMSQSQLYRKIKGLLGRSGNAYIRSLRLKKASELIKEQELNISEITYKVGFNDLQYFRKCFKTQYGVNPSDFLKTQKES